MAKAPACLFCKAPFEGIGHRCLSGPLASFDDSAGTSDDYDRGFADGWTAAMRALTRQPASR